MKSLSVLALLGVTMAMPTAQAQSGGPAPTGVHQTIWQSSSSIDATRYQFGKPRSLIQKAACVPSSGSCRRDADCCSGSCYHRTGVGYICVSG